MKSSRAGVPVRAAGRRRLTHGPAFLKRDSGGRLQSVKWAKAIPSGAMTLRPSCMTASGRGGRGRRQHPSLSAQPRAAARGSGTRTSIQTRARWGWGRGGWRGGSRYFHSPAGSTQGGQGSPDRGRLGVRHTHTH